MGPPLPAPGNGRAARGFPAELGGGGEGWPPALRSRNSPRGRIPSPRDLSPLSLRVTRLSPSDSTLSESLDSLRVTRLSPRDSLRGGGGGGRAPGAAGSRRGNSPGGREKMVVR